MTKKALVIEGGGIRSAYVAGVLLAFHQKGFRDFDVVVGSSAGACCGANFITGEPEKNRLILEKHLTGKRFVRFGKIFSKENIVDIDFLIDDICNGLVPIDFKKLKKSPVQFYITAMDYLTGETVYFNNHEHDILNALRASCAMPYLYRKKAICHGRRYMDGGMTESIPVSKAVAEGCNEIIVIRSREKDYRKKPERAPRWIHRLAFPDSPIMDKAFIERPILYNKTTDLLQTPPAGVIFRTITPSKRLPVSRVTRDPSKVKAAGKIGYDDGLNFLKNYKS